ncbi:MAG: hypothetical protein CM15mP66_00040 [Pseudomonadota bacterium]|nr:MAG: hypothetical protein CM15mP66_00040 [Pseudomonadota bacterium]
MVAQSESPADHGGGSILLPVEYRLGGEKFGLSDNPDLRIAFYLSLQKAFI